METMFVPRSVWRPFEPALTASRLSRRSDIFIRALRDAAQGPEMVLHCVKFLRLDSPNNNQHSLSVRITPETAAVLTLEDPFLNTFILNGIFDYEPRGVEPYDYMLFTKMGNIDNMLEQKRLTALQHPGKRKPKEPVVRYLPGSPIHRTALKHILDSLSSMDKWFKPGQEVHIFDPFDMRLGVSLLLEELSLRAKELGY